MREAQARIRASARARRAARGPAARIVDSAAIVQRLGEIDAVREAEAMAAFAPLAGEPDIWSLLESAMARGCTVLLPRVTGSRQLLWGAYVDRESLVANRWGILEPRDCAALSLATVDVVLVPAVAVDIASGARIGFGGGYYDTALSDVARRSRGGPLRIAPVFDEEVMTEMPANDWDARVDCIVTPTRIVHLDR